MSTTISAAATATTSGAQATVSDVVGSAQAKDTLTLISLLTAIGTAFAAFAVQMIVFELLRNKLVRIYIPKTYLVPEREQTRPPPKGILFWVQSIFTYRDREVISKCGLDGYFFLRYLQTLLIIFIPLACLILPILLPLNYTGGRESDFVTLLNTTLQSAGGNVTSLDMMAWGNISPSETNRYWAHLILAIVVVFWVCYVFFAELRVYIRVRQDYLTSAEHRLKASATTVLVSAIPLKWLTEEALTGLYDVFPGGIRNIWINRSYDSLLNKIQERDDVLKRFELAETQLIRQCKKAQLKQAERDEKRMSKKLGSKQLTKEEKEKKQKDVDGEADRMAHGEGTSSGDPHQVRHTVEDAVDDEESTLGEEAPERGRFKVPIFGAVSHGLGRGLGIVGDQLGKAGETIVGGAKSVSKEVDGQLGRTNGFMVLDSPTRDAATSFESISRQPTNQQAARVMPERRGEQARARPANAAYATPQADFSPSAAFQTPDIDHYASSRAASQASLHRAATQFGGDAARDMATREKQGSDNWLRFWRGPAVGYPSPVPHGYEGDDFPLGRNIDQVDGSSPMPRDPVTEGSTGRRRRRPTTTDRIRAFIQRIALVFSKTEEPMIEYPPYCNPEYIEDVEGGALWEKYIKKSDRPTHRIPRFSVVPGFLSFLPFLGQKVDSIYWCRDRLAELNVHIEEDQKHPENYKLMNSAFIQFNHQVAAHMASQAVSHHIPKHMAPRVVEVSPTDVIWGNMSIKWWEAWFRTFLVLIIVIAMTLLWAIPVGGTALLGNLSALVDRVPWLSFLNDNDVVRNAFEALGGVLPPLALVILLAIVPQILYLLATMQGNQTGMMRELSVQNYLFFFDFVQIFLVVSIASGALKTLSATATDVTSTPKILATELPKAANYFFYYLTLQALGNSSGALLQYSTLILWFLLPKLFDNTARDKWRRNTTLSIVNWGSYFPLYTTFACIALVYSVVTPLILVFAIITFGLYWIANRYCMLYIYKVKEDTGGLLYPRAINQTFAGLYVMEIFMIGLFVLVQDEDGNVACTPQAIIMVVVTALTILYQYLLNQAFSPLFRYLPITLEDEAVLRDEAFERAQAARLDPDHIDDNEGDDDERVDDMYYKGPGDVRKDEDIEMRALSRSATSPEGQRYNRYDPRRGIAGAAGWATRGTAAIRNKTLNRNASRSKNRVRRRHRDLEAQQKVGNALFGGIADEIEDLLPHERDALVNHAFKHEAARARRPTVWIPRDDLGISDEEIRRTEDFSAGNIWISNEGTALDSKIRVVYGKNPPDFSYVDLIKL